MLLVIRFFFIAIIVVGFEINLLIEDELKKKNYVSF